MYRTTALRALFACALALPLACSDGSGPPPEDEDVNSSKGDDDSAEDDTSEEDDTSDDDAPPATKDASVGGKIDGGTKLIDSGAKDTPKADAGPKADASDTAKPDATTKADAGTTPVASDRPKPKCMKKDSELIVIGDSYIDWFSHSFPQQIVEVSGQKWSMHAVGGSSMATGGLTGFIPDQFTSAIATNKDAHTVLMDGGGNDILLPDLTLDPFNQCTEAGSSKNANCQKIVSEAIRVAGTLMERMVTAGIRDVVYFFYPHIPVGRALGNGAPNEILDYALPLVRDFCNGREAASGGKLRCTFIDMVPVFEGHDPDWFNEDIHPNSKGSQAMAEKVWEVMTEKCIGQKGPKDCCES